MNNEENNGIHFRYKDDPIVKPPEGPPPPPFVDPPKGPPPPPFEKPPEGPPPSPFPKGGN